MNTTKKQVGEVMSDYFKLINELPYDDFEIKVIDKIDVVYLLIKVDNYKDMGDYYSSVGREPNAIARIAKSAVGLLRICASAFLVSPFSGLSKVSLFATR